MMSALGFDAIVDPLLVHLLLLTSVILRFTSGATAADCMAATALQLSRFDPHTCR